MIVSAASAERTSGEAPYLIAGVSPDHDMVEAWATARLPFEPKGWLRQMRDSLAQAIRSIGDEPDRVLHAQYLSSSRDYCDAENVLFYNVGSGCFATSARTGLRFERAFSAPPPHPNLPNAPHYYRYSLAPRRGTFAHWQRGRALIHWNAAPCRALTELRKPAQVWNQMRGGTGEVRPEGSSTPPLFGLTVTIGVPVERALNLTNLVKTIFDGVIAAFHVHDGTLLHHVSDRLSTSLVATPDEIAEHLMDRRMAVLGPRRLVWPFGPNGVQWNPADDRCVAGELLTQAGPSDGQWHLSCVLYEVQPRSQPSSLILAFESSKDQP